jgi:hypothetical protein
MLVKERGMTALDLSRVHGASRNLGAMILRGENRLAADPTRYLRLSTLRTGRPTNT